MIMTTEKLLLMIIPFTLTVVAVVLGFKSYSISLRNSIRYKYRRFIGTSEVEQMIEKEYNQILGWTVAAFIFVVLMVGALSYFVVLCLKNNIPLIS